MAYLSVPPRLALVGHMEAHAGPLLAERMLLHGPPFQGALEGGDHAGCCVGPARALSAFYRPACHTDRCTDTQLQQHPSGLFRGRVHAAIAPCPLSHLPTHWALRRLAGIRDNYYHLTLYRGN